MGLIKPLGGGGLGPSSGKRNIKAVREKSPWQEVGAQVFWERFLAGKCWRTSLCEAEPRRRLMANKQEVWTCVDVRHWVQLHEVEGSTMWWPWGDLGPTHHSPGGKEGWAGSPVPRSIPGAASVSSILGDRGYNRKSLVLVLVFLFVVFLEPMCFFVVIPQGPFLCVNTKKRFKFKILPSGHYSLFIRY